MTDIDLEAIKEKAKSWLGEGFDDITKREVKQLLDSRDTKPLIDAFYRNLEFGTGGLRGKMGVGTNRINSYTLGLITQGLSNYALENFTDNIKVVIAHDTRNNSQTYARETAEIFAANGIKAYLFPAPRPTPQLSFAIRKLKCQLGIVLTASHNPKEYNGYKVYFEDGGQIVSPWDKKIMAAIEQVTDFTQIKKGGTDIEILDASIDEEYFAMIKNSLFYPDQIADYATHSPVNFLYSPLHGTGVQSVIPCLKNLGFTGLRIVEAQNVSDGNFPTVTSPNPEERVALELGVAQMEREDIKFFFATDPDSDRIAVVCREEGELYYLTGNQIGVLLADYMLSQLKAKNKLPSSGYVARTIVTSTLIDALATSYGVKTYALLTGFKYIAELIRLSEEQGKEQFIFGMEESYGYLLNATVRDKDAVSAATMLTEMFYQLEKRGSNFKAELDRIYNEHGYYLDQLKSIVKEGFDGVQAIKELMHHYRTNPPTELAGIAVQEVRDYLNKINGLPSADVIQMELKDGTRITIRPSGTEPKIKYYFNLKQDIIDGNLEKTKVAADRKMAKIMASME